MIKLKSLITEGKWEDIPNADSIKSDIYTLFKRKTKLKDAKARIMKSNPDVTDGMFYDVWYAYKNESPYNT